MKKSEDISVRGSLQTYSNLGSKWVPPPKKANCLMSESNKMETIASFCPRVSFHLSPSQQLRDKVLLPTSVQVLEIKCTGHTLLYGNHLEDNRELNSLSSI